MQDMDKTKKCCAVQSAVPQKKNAYERNSLLEQQIIIKILCYVKDLGFVNWIKLA